MKKHYLLALAFLPLFASGQLKQIAFAELTAGSGMFFGAEMSTTTITVTLQGPADRYLAFGFGTGMANGNDALIWSTLGSGAATLQVRDHRMIGSGSEPSVDAQQDWTIISNNVSGGNRTIVASRGLNTGDANDVTFNFAATTQNLFWAKGPSASNQLQYHGGNRASGIVRNWTLVDQTPPTLNTTTPADNASGVSLTGNLTLAFNEPVSWGTGSITLYDGSNNVIQTVSSGSPQVTFFGNNAIFNPTANLVPNTDYYVHVEPTALKDAANNFFAGFTDNTTWNFNTNDVTAPTLIANPFVPADNAVAVAVGTNLVVTFNENVQTGAGLIELFDGSGALVESFDVATSPAVTVTGAAVTVNPTSDLALNEDYYVHIAAGAIEDVSGNDYAGISNNTTWNFNTNDIVAPTAVSPFDPADNATGVATSGVFTITFSEDIALTASGALELRTSAGVLVESFNDASSGLAVTGDELQITTTGPLTDETGYYITIANGFVTDLAGNAFTGFTDNATWNFTTGDFTGPLPSALSPADNATAVPVNTQLTMTFNEDIDFNVGSIHLIDDTGGSSEEFDVITSPNVSITGATLTITPSADLEPGHAYHVEIDGNVITDLSGNTFAGIADATTWNFVTDDDSGIDELSKAGVSWNGSVLSIDSQSPFTANLYDPSGKLVHENLGQKTTLSDLNTGVYLVTIVRSAATQTVRIYVR